MPKTQGIIDACESSDDQENDAATLAFSVYTSTQFYSIALNFKFTDHFFPHFLDIKYSKCITSLKKKFDPSLSKNFAVLALSIISPNAP